MRNVIRKASGFGFIKSAVLGVTALCISGSPLHAGPTQSGHAIAQSTNGQRGFPGQSPIGDPLPGAVGVNLDTDISWQPAPNVDSYEVYFGTDSTPDDTEFLGSTNAFSYVLDALNADTTYYWRIDSVGEFLGSPITIPGNVWSFTTGAVTGFDLNVREVSYDTSVPLPVDERVLVHTVVTNDLDLHTTSLHISFYASDDNIITEDDRRIDWDIITEDIPAFGSYEEDRSIYIPEDLKGEEFYIGVIVTGTGDVPEENLSNNVLSGSSPLDTVAVVYDLVAEDCVYEQFGLYNQGDPVLIEYFVSNVGDFYSPAPMDFYISEDAIITPSDTYIGSSNAQAQPGLLANWYSTQNLPDVVPTGDWFIGFIVSHDGVVDATPGDNWVSGFYPIYVVGTDACDADLNGDGVLNFFDVSAFLSAFSAGDPAGDFNGDGQFNFFDVSAFLQAFSAGCP